MTRQTACYSDIDVVPFIGIEPKRLFEFGLARDRRASIEVCISSPVRSKNPVLINTTR